MGTGKNTVRETWRSDGDVAGELGEHAGDAVGGAGGSAARRSPDLALDHHHPARRRRELLDRAQDRGGGDPVGQVGDDLGRGRVQRGVGRGRARRRCAASRWGARRARRAAPARGVRSTSTTCTCARARPGTRRGRQGRRRSPARRRRGRARGAPDHAEEVGVDEEVLAQLAVGRDAERAQPAQARLDRLGHGSPPEQARRRCARRRPRRSRGGRRGPPRRRARCATTWRGSLGLPRTGWGARNGASVSTSRRSAGTRAAASRSSGAFGKVTLPANEIQYPRARHSSRRSGIEKQWRITRRPSAWVASRSRVSSSAARVWMTTGLSSSRASSMLGGEGAGLVRPRGALAVVVEAGLADRRAVAGGRRARRARRGRRRRSPRRRWGGGRWPRAPGGSPRRAAARRDTSCRRCRWSGRGARRPARRRRRPRSSAARHVEVRVAVDHRFGNSGLERAEPRAALARPVGGGRVVRARLRRARSAPARWLAGR